jgi:hypothetical protein
MDVNNHPLHNKFYTLLNKCRIDMEEFSHKCWGPKEPYPHHLDKHALAALSCIHNLESEAGRFILVFATSIRHTTQSADAGLHKMGTSCPTLMGQNALEVSTPFSYPIIHVIPNNTKPAQAQSSNYGNLLLPQPRDGYD